MEKKKSGYLYILLTAVIFSTMEVALKLVSGIFAPMQITVIRFFVGGVVLLPIAILLIKKHNKKLKAKDFGFFAVSGLLCVVLSMVIYEMAVSTAKASEVAVVFSGNPIFVTVLAFLILHEAIHYNSIIALCVEILGIVIIVNPFSQQVNPTGIILSIVSAILFALYSVLGKRRSKEYGSLVITCFSFIFGSLELLCIIGLGYIQGVANAFSNIGLNLFVNVPLFDGISLDTILPLAYICVINSAAGYVFYMLAMEKTTAHEASIVFFLKPIIAPVIAWFMLGEAITPVMVAGIVCFLAGSLISILPEIIKERKMLNIVHIHK